jgi:outer membrane protein insertion porin family
LFRRVLKAAGLAAVLTSTSLFAQAPSSAEPSAPTQAPENESDGKPKIIGIRVIGYQTVTPDTIAHYLGIKVGDTYDADKIRSNFQTLWDVGLLENATIEVESAPAGVTLLVTIEERPMVSAVDYQGNKKISVSQIKDRLREQKVEVKAGAPLSLRDIAKVRAAIADYYTEQGFRSATVDFRVEDVSKTEKKVVFTMDEGDKIKIASIHFTGNKALSERALRAAMKKTKVNVLWRLLSENTTYSQANYEADVELLKAVYQSKGYKDVVIKDPILDVFIANPKVDPKKAKRRMRITIPVVEGERFFTGEIRIVKMDQSGQPQDESAPMIVPRARMLKEFAELPPGSVLNRERIIEALSHVEALYKSRGYIYWFADPSYKEVGDHRVDVDVKIFEGDKFYLGRLEVTGNTVTRDKVVRREFALDEGDVMNMEAVKKSLQKLQQLGYFKIQEEPEFAVRQEEKKVDLVLKGNETSKNEVQFGAGYSALDGFFGQFSFQTRNFLGRGEILGASVQIGKISKFYDLSYTVPWWMDRNQSIGASIFKRETDYLNITDKRTGGSVFYGKGLGLFDSLSAIYSYEDIVATFPVSGAATPPGQPPPPTKFTDVTGRTSSVTPGYRYDSRNDPFDPNAGKRLSVSVQFAGSILGGSDYFVKPILAGSIYVPVRIPRHSYLALNVEVAYIKAYGGKALPIFDRFQIGGEQSIRGFRIGSILPLKANNQVFTDDLGHILGGNKYWVFNAEYVFVQVGPAKLLAFGDVGNVYSEEQNLSFQHLRTGVGLELRIFLPIFQAPLRFIYSFNLHPITPIDQFGFPITNLKEKRSGFDFSIGRTF